MWSTTGEWGMETRIWGSVHPFQPNVCCRPQKLFLRRTGGLIVLIGRLEQSVARKIARNADVTVGNHFGEYEAVDGQEIIPGRGDHSTVVGTDVILVNKVRRLEIGAEDEPEDISLFRVDKDLAMVANGFPERPPLISRNRNFTRGGDIGFGIAMGEAAEIHLDAGLFLFDREGEYGSGPAVDRLPAQPCQLACGCGFL